MGTIKRSFNKDAVSVVSFVNKSGKKVELKLNKGDLELYINGRYKNTMLNSASDVDMSFLEDVDLSGVTTGSVLKYDAATQEWKVYNLDSALTTLDNKITAYGNDNLGTVAYDAAAPTPERSGKYTFSTGSESVKTSWITISDGVDVSGSGGAYVSQNDTVIVVYDADLETYVYEHISNSASYATTETVTQDRADAVSMIAHNAAAPTPVIPTGTTKTYEFSSGGSCTWITAGATTVEKGDKVTVSFTAPSTFVYTYQDVLKRKVDDSQVYNGTDKAVDGFVLDARTGKTLADNIATESSDRSKGYIYLGFATTSTVPSTYKSTDRVYYVIDLPVGTTTLTNFGLSAITLTESTRYELRWGGTSWTAVATNIANKTFVNTKLQQLNQNVWGLKKQVGSSSLFWTRIYPELHAQRRVHKSCGRYLELSGVRTYLHPTNSLKDINGNTVDLSGAQGNVWWRKPAYYFKAEIATDPIDGLSYEYQWMSDQYFSGAIYMPERSCSPWHMCVNRSTNVAASLSFLTWNSDGSIARDVNGFPVYTANAATYRGGDNNATYDTAANSRLGMAVTNCTKAQAVAWATAAAAHVGFFSLMDEIRTLYRFEYACDDIQQTYNATLDAYGNKQGGLGTGKAVVSGEWSTFNGYNPFIPMGVTCSLGNQTGLVPYVIKNWAGVGVDKTIQVDSFLGLEALSEYLTTNTDDLLVYYDTVAGRIKAYHCTDPTKFANPASDTTTIVPTGYNYMCDLPLVDGFISAMTLPPLSLPTSVAGGASNKFVPDYYYHPGSAGWFCSGLGAYANSGSSAGLAFLDAGSRVSIANASWGFRLCR